LLFFVCFLVCFDGFPIEIARLTRSGLAKVADFGVEAWWGPGGDPGRNLETGHHMAPYGTKKQQGMRNQSTQDEDMAGFLYFSFRVESIYLASVCHTLSMNCRLIPNS
jgi:hypothetical protein